MNYSKRFTQLITISLVLVVLLSVIMFCLGWTMKANQVNCRLKVSSPVAGNMYVVDSTEDGLIIVVPQIH